jgi:zinc/manganese transport system substrate-binding protein
MAMNNRIHAALFAIALCALPARAALQVFACEPEWGALVAELAGDRAEVYVATTALQDVHQIQARPSLIAKMRRADLVVCTGAQLESGWLPLVLRQAANPRVQPNQPGYFEAFRHVTMLEVPERLDRAEGDVHPAGNPHIQGDPRNIAKVAGPLAERLAALDPAGAAEYARRHDGFRARWVAALDRWTARAAPLAGAKVVAHHRSLTYLAVWLRLEQVAYLEPKPSIPPSAAHLASLLKQLEGLPVKAIVRVAYEDSKPSAWLAERIHAPAVVVPQTIGANAQAKDLFSLYDAAIDALLGAK